MSFLLARITDESELPDKFYEEFAAQFCYWQGSYAPQIDVESLMILLWQMEQRIKQLEASNERI